jgi:hypothetical protein
MTCSCVGCVKWVQLTSSTLRFVVNESSDLYNSNMHKSRLALGLPRNEAHNLHSKE